MKKNGWSIALLAMLFILLMGAAALADDQYTLCNGGGSRSWAVGINMNQTYAGELTEKDESQWYCFTTPAQEGYITFRAMNTSVHGDVYFYLKTGIEEIKHKTSHYYNRSSNANMKLDPSTTYYIQVCNENNATGYFRVAAEFTEDQVGDTYDKASSISLGREVIATMDGKNDTDMFSFTVPANGEYILTGVNDSIYTSLCWGIYTADDQCQGKDSTYRTYSFSKIYELKAGITYYVSCSVDGWSEGSYHFTIDKYYVPIQDKCSFSWISTHAYTGGEIKPDITIKDHKDRILMPGVDYTVTYQDNIGIGTATMTVTGIGSYTGSKTVEFKIKAVEASGIKLAKTKYTYTGKEITPAVTVTAVVGGMETILDPKTDYTVSYSSNLNAGTGKVTVKCTGNFSGQFTSTFDIAASRITSVALDRDSVTYSGNPWKPEETVTATVDKEKVTLKRGSDYTVTYAKNVNAGTATVTVTGKGNYKGTAKAKFSINQVIISDLILDNSDFAYTGKAIKPGTTVRAVVNGKTQTLKAGQDYSVSYSANTNPGKATVTVKGKGNYTGKLKTDFSIYYDLSKAEISLNKTKWTYTGKAIQPKATVTLTIKGKSVTLRESDGYTVSCDNCVKPGEYCVYIEATDEGNCRSYNSASFTIVPAAPGSLSVKAAKGGATLKWSQGKPSGGHYEIVYTVKKDDLANQNPTKISLDPTAFGNKKAASLSGLKNNKKYYMKIRYVVNGVASEWTSVKSVTTK